MGTYIIGLDSLKTERLNMTRSVGEVLSFADGREKIDVFESGHSLCGHP